MSTADVIFTGGRIFSAGMRGSEAADVALRGGRIQAVDAPGALEDLRAPRTQMVDLRGKLLLPGFQDAHMHPLRAGAERLLCDLATVTDAAACIAAIADYATRNRNLEWIEGGSWVKEIFDGGTPTRQMLDAIVPDRPVLLFSADHHSAWVNTRALELAGVTASTPDPSDGRIERDGDGTPAGMLYEGAVKLIEAVKPDLSADLVYQGMLIAQQELAELGIVGWQDAAIGSIINVPDPLGVYLRGVEAGTLRARVTGALWWDRERSSEQIADLIALRDRAAAAGSPRFRANTVKIMVDGILEDQTAAISLPYLDPCGHPTSNTGLSFLAPEALREVVTTLDSLGFQMHFHALGDRAVTETLDALAAARASNGARDHRHHLAHLQVVADADIPRFAELDAIANLQMVWGANEPHKQHLIFPFLDPALVQRNFPFGALHAARATFAAGSDWPVSSADPIAAVHIGVNRVLPGGEGEPLGGAHQRLDLATALTAYTAGTAYGNHDEDRSGHLKPGHDADLVVLDRDPFAMPIAHIHEAAVTKTWIDGRLVYEA